MAYLPVASLDARDCIKEARQGIVQQLKSEEAVIWMFSDKDEARIRKLLKRAFAGQGSIFTRILIPLQGEWSSKVYATHAIGQRNGTATVVISHFGAMEARLLTSGSEIIAGVPLGKIPGDSVKDKRTFVFSATQGVLQELIKGSGWMCKLSRKTVGM